MIGMQYYTAPVGGTVDVIRACDNCRECAADRMNNLVDGFDIVRGGEWKCRNCGYEFRTIDGICGNSDPE